METSLYKHSFKVKDRPLTSLSVHNTGLQRCAGGYSWGPGVRDHYLIHCVTEGSGTYTLQGKTYVLHEGDMFIARPKEMIRYQADDKTPWTYCWVGFGGLDAKDLISQTDFSVENPILHAQNADMPRQLLLDIYACRGARPFEIARMTGKLYAFLSWLMEQAKEEPRYRRQAGREHVDHACEFIAGNFASNISIGDIARNVGVCRSLLNRAFQQHVGISPVQYLAKYRMVQACRLLEESDMAVKTVAYSVGYEDPLYFSRRFREIVGCAPREYADGMRPETDKTR